MNSQDRSGSTIVDRVDQNDSRRKLEIQFFLNLSAKVANCIVRDVIISLLSRSERRHCLFGDMFTDIQ